MNHIYRIVYNSATNTYQAVPENSTGKHKTASEKSSCAVSDVSEKGAFFSLKPMALCAMAMGLSSTGAWAAPTGGHISAGDASIAQHGKITNIQQNSQKAAINWQSFGIKADETVNFKQPNAQAVILNRVIGNEKSVIDGAMNANGKVFISNPNGMIIGKNAQINVGALLATTAKIKDQDFMNGFFKFDEATGDITHLGDIKVPTGGVVALIAPIVENKGKITAPQGKVLLASAEQFSITLPDNGQFAYTLDRGTLQGLVDNGGAILADGGHVILTAKGTDAVKKSLIKHTGKIEANTVQNKNGVIELLGDLDNSRLEVSGSLKAEAKENGDGGFIETSAADVKIQETAQISTKAENGKDGKYLLDPNDLIIGENGVMTGSQVGDMLANNGDFELKSTNGKAEGKGDVIINDEINWNQGKLTLNAQNDIHINKTLNGTGTAKLALEYGHDTDRDVYIQDKVTINLPEGKNLSIKKGYSDKYELSVIHSLPTGNDFLDKDIAIGKDIDMSGIIRNNGWNFPVTDGKYYGSLWGLGHKISNLNITTTNRDNNVAFIPKLDGGVIRNLDIQNINIIGNENVGSVIGKARSSGPSIKISNIDVSGTLFGTKYVGGIVGNTELYGYGGGVWGVDGNIDIHNINTNLKVEGSDSIGGVVGYTSLFGVGVGGSVLDIKKINTNNSQIMGNENVGGIVGNTDIQAGSIARLEIHQVAVNGNVTGNVNNVGGIIGNANVASANAGLVQGWGDIFLKDSYSNAIVNGKENIGGLIGKLKTNNSTLSNIERVYLTGSTIGGINANIDIGGLDSTNSTFKVNFTNSFFDNSKISQNNKNGLIGKNTTEMKQKSTFTDWDFDKVWRIDEGKDYPRLQALTQGEITVSTTPSVPTTQTQSNNIYITAPEVTKTYDGMPIYTVDDLKKLQGWKDIHVTGLQTGDSLGELTIDKNLGNWVGAVNARDYELFPTTINPISNDLLQKYKINWNLGKLTIKPLEVVISGSKVYDKTTNITEKHITNTHGVLSQDMNKISVEGTGEMNNDDVGINHLVSNNFKITGIGASNYKISDKSGEWKVTPHSLELYGHKMFDNTNSIDGSKVFTKDFLAMPALFDLNKDDKYYEVPKRVYPGDDVSVIGTDILPSKNRGTYLLGKQAFSLIGKDAKNYKISDDKYNVEVVVTPKPITLKAIIDEKVFDGNNYSPKTPIIIHGELLGNDTISTSQYFESSNPQGRYNSVIIPKFILSDGNNGRNYDVRLNNAKGTIISLDEARYLDLSSLKKVNDFYDWEMGLTKKHPDNIRFNDKNAPIIELKPFSDDDLSKLELDEMDKIIQSIHRYNQYHQLPRDKWNKYRNMQNSILEDKKNEIDAQIHGWNFLKYSGKGLVSKEGFIYLSKLATLSADTVISIGTAGKLNNLNLGDSKVAEWVETVQNIGDHPSYDVVKRLMEETSGYLGGSYNSMNSTRNYTAGTFKLALGVSGQDLKEGSFEDKLNKKLGAAIDIADAASKLAIYFSENPEVGLSKDDAFALASFLTDTTKALLSIPGVKENLVKAAGINTLIEYGNTLNEASKAGERYGNYIGDLMDRDVQAIDKKYMSLIDELRTIELKETIKYNQNHRFDNR